MPLARLSNDRLTTLELLHATPDGSAVLADHTGRRTWFHESSPSARIEVRCELCGEWTPAYARDGGRWQCVRHLALGRRVA